MFKVGMRVKSCLDTYRPSNVVYIGTIIDVDGNRLCIRRDDGLHGGGIHESWIARVAKENLKHITILSNGDWDAEENI